MISSKSLRFVIIIMVVVSIMIYSLLDKYFPSLSGPLEISKYIAAVVGVYATGGMGFFMKIAGIPIIKGTYEGTSDEKDKNGMTVKTHKEKFTITQNLMGAQISGSSRMNGGLISTWNGDLAKNDGKEFIFLIKVKADVDYDGVLSLTMHDNGKISGTCNYYNANKAHKADIVDAVNLSKYDWVKYF